MIQTQVYQREEARFNMAGEFLHYPLTLTSAKIKPGLVKRLMDYARERLETAGFVIPEEWSTEVETMDHDSPPVHRAYTVAWVTPKDGRIGVQGIMINRGGWPFIDHGPFIEY